MPLSLVNTALPWRRSTWP